MPAVQFYRSFCRHLFTHLICSILSTHWLTCFSGKWETRIVVLVLFFFFRIFKEKAIFLTLYTHLYPRSDWQGIYSLYFFKLVLLNFIFIHGNLSNRYPTDSSWSEYRNEETVRIRIESTEWEKLESWPVLAAPGTDQNSESLFYTVVRLLRWAWLKGVFSSHLQLATSLHAHMDQQ